MNRKRPPTKQGAARMAAVKELECIVCGYWPVDVHHLTRGGRRLGDRYTVPLCRWHHLRHPPEPFDHAGARNFYGPSLMDGSKVFHEAHGSDDELLARTDAKLAPEHCWDE
jgi:hypothetical protein